MKNYVEIAKATAQTTQNLGTAAPEAMKALGALMMATTMNNDGALSHRQKEMIALAIAVSCRCEGCIAHHAKACVEAGVTREEVAEVIGVCILMGGGPSTAYGGQALMAYDQFVAAAK